MRVLRGKLGRRQASDNLNDLLDGIMPTVKPDEILVPPVASSWCSIPRGVQDIVPHYLIPLAAYLEVHIEPHPLIDVFLLSRHDRIFVK